LGRKDSLPFFGEAGRKKWQREPGPMQNEIKSGVDTVWMGYTCQAAPERLVENVPAVISG
jgi:hypothetical protein